MKKPEVIINVASSLDGVIASNDGALILSSTEDWVRVHELRNSVDAILIGINTVLKDDPMLTVRYVEAKTPGPLRIILDSQCKIPLNANVLKNQNLSKTLLITSEEVSEEKIRKVEKLGISTLRIKKSINSQYLDLLELLNILKTEFRINRLLVEGGSTIITQFIKENLVDIMFIFYAPVFVGVKEAKMLFEESVIKDIADSIPSSIIDIKRVGEGFLIKLKFQKVVENE